MTAPVSSAGDIGSGSMGRDQRASVSAARAHRHLIAHRFAIAHDTIYVLEKGGWSDRDSTSWSRSSALYAMWRQQIRGRVAGVKSCQEGGRAARDVQGPPRQIRIDLGALFQDFDGALDLLLNPSLLNCWIRGCTCS
jgi:hypothetical protein